MPTSLLNDAALTMESRESALALQLCELASDLDAADEAQALFVLEEAGRQVGACAALFVWASPELPGHFWYRTMAALDQGWASAVLRRIGTGLCDWMNHPARSTEPLRIQSPHTDEPTSPSLQDSDAGATVVWLVPAPSAPRCDALGLLVIAGADDQQLAISRRTLPLFRSLALSFSEWVQRHSKEELIRHARLTDRDLDLLHREALGQSSKRIAEALSTEPKTIDCRFHRLNARLGVPNRREAVRLCRRYGLI